MYPVILALIISKSVAMNLGRLLTLEGELNDISCSTLGVEFRREGFRGGHVPTEVDQTRPAADVPRARGRLSPIGTKGVEKEKVRRRSKP